MSVHRSRIAELYRSHFDDLVGFLTRRVASRELAADLVQELFLRLLSRDGSVAAIRHDRGFLFRSARHLAVEVRRTPRWRDVPQEPLPEPTALVPSPEVSLADRQTVDRLAVVIERLPPRCREAFVLHKFEHLTYPQVAKHLGISVSAVEKHMARALDACRTAMDGRRR